MKTAVETLLTSLTEGELIECLNGSMKHYQDLLIHGESRVDAETPFGQMQAALKQDRNSNTEETERSDKA